MNVKVCEFCGKRFPTRSNNTKYCSKKCRMDAIARRREENGQLCYLCKNACGGCSWSKHFIPVKGWEAIPTIIKDSEGDICSYKINKCPEFVRG